MKHVAILAGFCILIIIRPAGAWASKGPTADELGILVQAATFWIGLPEKPGAMAYLIVPEGTVVKILGEEGAYFRVNHKDLIGYLEQELVQRVEPDLEPDPERPVNVEPPFPRTISENRPAPYAAPMKARTDYFVVTEKTSLRESPDSQAEVLLRLSVDAKMEVLDSSGKYWWKVQYNGRTGWVKSALLRKE